MGGTVTYTEFSEANSFVLLQDNSGTEWRCLVSNDGRMAEVSRSDGGGSASTASAEPTTTTEVVRFGAGTSGQQRSGALSPGSSVRYVLGASKGQDLTVQFVNTDPSIEYQIFNPNGTFLLDRISAGQQYGGQLWQSGDHVVEVINRGSTSANYAVYMGIE